MSIKDSKKNIEGLEVEVLDEQRLKTYARSDKQHVFIVGSKGIPAAYGGFETFVDKLTAYQVSDRIQYYVARMADDEVCYLYHQAVCFNVKVPKIGAAKAIYYDIAALNRCIQYCKQNRQIQQPVFYVLACRIGPVIGYFKKKIQKLGGVLYVNPDGHEWLRAKWSAPVRKYWKISERLMVKHADLLICDSINIEKYIKKTYRCFKPHTTFIAYGSEISKSTKEEKNKIADWLAAHGLRDGAYYLAVGRFVPENNYKVMIREFMKAHTAKDFVIVTTQNGTFMNALENELHFKEDSRIRFVGTIYDQELLQMVREHAYGYLHGHEVGGTNPSLLEALGSTNLNLLYDIGFNREVAEQTARYWTKEPGNLAALIEQSDDLSKKQLMQIGEAAKKRIADSYSWEFIVKTYEELFLRRK